MRRLLTEEAGVERGTQEAAGEGERGDKNQEETLKRES